MKLLSIDIASIALKSVLLRRLQEIVYSLKEALRRDKVSDLSSEGYLSKDIEQPQTVPLTIINRGTFEIEYVSAIALKLSRLTGELSADLAQTIVAQTIGARLTESIKTVEDKAIARQSLSDALWRNFTVKVVPPGWIHLQLSDLGLASWLQILTERSIRLDDRSRENFVYENDNQLLRNSTKLFELQHTHARCCSQIYLAQQAELLSSLNPSTLSHFYSNEPQAGSVSMPKLLPWLDSNQSLRFQHPAEQRLIAQLVATVDTLSDAPFQPSILKAGETLSQNFIDFHAACRIFAEVKTADLDLAQARLGLVLATRNVLKALLEEGLAICAPLEL
ncbi:MAG: hypothetical protein HC899_19260 [Leptolyngbyaceae cyanobacterium SM1_4_3]|nr:hypothetical protein [Leptolyngbyaceae cyanobacterium SM1_4_3]NJN90171.1 hypothetical protein [Leptolyngbyaceae cyanobacterium SL_5_14]NJO67055.1 hypothetical protein [Leptolyngbyaceae cyanobacterium RM1_405_57]